MLFCKKMNNAYSRKKYTIDDFKKIEEGEYCQLINGEIIMSPAPSSKHQEILAEIFTAIYLCTKNNKRITIE